MRYFLGLDIGGTKTTCVLADEHQRLSLSRAGSAKILRVGEAEAAANLEHVLNAVSLESGVALSQITASCIGTSGAGVPRVVEWLKAQMAISVGGKLTLVGDEIIALDAAFKGGAGVLVIAGTGSNVIGRGHGGNITGAGGWGPALADEGSGNLLGQQALKNIFSAINLGEDPSLLHRVLESLGLASREELIAAANAADFSFAQLMPVIVSAARDKDAIAQRTLHAGGKQLAGLVLSVIRKLAAVEPGIEDGLAIACTGSILEYVLEVRDSMKQSLLRSYPRLRFIAEVVDPLEGALWHARALANTV
jgi:glucosamine kinase